MKSTVTGNSTPHTQPTPDPPQGEKKSINPELWQACAGPLVNLPAAGTHVVYFPQGHSEHVAASMKKDVDGQIPSYPNLPSKILCLLHNVTLHADPETDEVYAQMTLQPVPSFDKEALLRSDLSVKANKPQPDFFCKTLTASDTSTHGGFSVPRRAAEKIFPPLDFSMQPPAQELVARDLHDNVWNFRHIYRGQPKRHLLTTGWSLFVNGKRLFAGDSVLFIRDEKHHLLLGIRRANRQPTNLSSSVLSSDSMHIGVLAAAAHAAANNSPFTVFYNPRTSPSEFVIPLAKYYKAIYGQQIALGMRFRMMFETEESGTRRYMGTITGISDLDPVRWKNSQWRNLQVGWDESTTGERRTRVSVWEIEPVTAPFFICPPPFLRPKHPRLPGMPEDESEMDNLSKRTKPWLGDDPNAAFSGLSLVQWMNMQQNPSLGNPMQSNFLNTLPGSTLQNLLPTAQLSHQLGFTTPQIPQQHNLQSTGAMNSLSSLLQSQLCDMTQQQRENLVNPAPASNLVQPQLLQSQAHGQNVSSFQQQSLLSQQSTLQQVNLMNHLQGPLVDGSQSFSRSLPPTQVSGIPPIQLESLSQAQIIAQQIAKCGNQNGLHFSQPSQLPKLEPGIIPEMQGQAVLATNPMPNHLSTAGHSAITGDIPSCSTNNGPETIINGRVHRSNAIGGEGLSQSPANHLISNSLVTISANTAITDDIPSCSTNNGPDVARTIINSRGHRSNAIGGEGISQSPANPLISNSLVTISTNTANSRGHRSNAIGGEGTSQSPANPLISNSLLTISANTANVATNIAKGQNQGLLARQTYQSIPASQMDYVDTSSATSVSVSQNDVISQSNPLSNSQPIFIADAANDVEVQADLRNNIHTGANVNGLLGTSLPDVVLANNIAGSHKNFSSNASSTSMLSNYETTKDAAQQELSSSMVTQSFGVPDMANFNSIDSGISDGSFMNRGAWGPPPQYQRMRTYTKVYKRGAVGRSIDVTRYSGYEELKQDLARMFGVEGQMEDRGRIGWKLVYVDHENDVLLVGDDPWDDFVNCVRCIKILSPQEVQQMSLDGDFGNNASLPNQAYSSSDGGNV